MIAELQNSDSWALVVSFRKREWPNKGTDLGGWLQECNLMVFRKAEGIGEEGKACQICVLQWARAPSIYMYVCCMVLLVRHRRHLHDVRGAYCFCRSVTLGLWIVDIFLGDSRSEEGRECSDAPPPPSHLYAILIAHHLERRDDASISRLRKTRERGFICGYREAIIHVG